MIGLKINVNLKKNMVDKPEGVFYNCIILRKLR